MLRLRFRDDARPARRQRNVRAVLARKHARGRKNLCLIDMGGWSRIFCTAQSMYRAHSAPKPGHIALSPHWAGRSFVALTVAFAAAVCGGRFVGQCEKLRTKATIEGDKV